MHSEVQQFQWNIKLHVHSPRQLNTGAMIALCMIIAWRCVASSAEYYRRPPVIICVLIQNDSAVACEVGYMSAWYINNCQHSFSLLCKYIYIQVCFILAWFDFMTTLLYTRIPTSYRRLKQWRLLTQVFFQKPRTPHFRLYCSKAHAAVLWCAMTCQHTSAQHVS